MGQVRRARSGLRLDLWNRSLICYSCAGSEIAMDLFAVVAVMSVVLLLIVAVASLFMQQSGQLREIQAQLSKLEGGGSADPSQLRIERAAWIDPLVLLEVSLVQSDLNELAPEQMAQIDAARSGVKAITEQLKASGEWMGPPYDLEWVEHLDRMPRLKSIYMKSGFATDTASSADS